MFRIKELRTEKGLSMRQTALELGIPYTTYISYEKEDREPNSETLIKLADYFGCSVDYLIGRSNQNSIEKSDIRNIQYAAYEALGDESEEFQQDILDYINYKKAQKKKSNYFIIKQTAKLGYKEFLIIRLYR